MRALREKRMDEPETLKALRMELDKQLRIFSARRRRDKRKSTALQMATVSLSAIITVLLGLRLDPKPGSILTNVALGLGAVVTILAAYDSFFDHRKLWVMRTITVRRLEDLQRELQFRCATSEENLNDLSNSLFSRLNQILEDDHEEWLRMRNKRDPAMPGGMP
jgi:hypothetical protein